MKKLKKPIRIVIYIILFPFLFLLGYAIMTVVLTLIPSNMFADKQDEDVVIYARSNGVHTDIVVPVKTEVYDWNTFIDTSLFKNKTATHLAIGWGDKGFYLNTPDWADLKFSTAFNAMFRLSTSAMHVVTCADTPRVGERCMKLSISREKYKELISYIQEKFQTQQGKALPIHGHHYSGIDDYFFDANGKYSFWYTCNCWANNGLKVAGVRTATWAPFAKSIFYWRRENI